MIAAGLRRLAIVVVALSMFTAAMSLLIGLAAGFSALRSVSLGFMVIGSFLFIAGAAVGLHDPARPRPPLIRSSGSAPSSGPADWSEAFNTSAILVGLGVAFVLLGIALDPYVRLF